MGCIYVLVFINRIDKNLSTAPAWETVYEETDHIRFVFFACSALYDANVEEE